VLENEGQFMEPYGMIARVCGKRNETEWRVTE